MVVHLRLRTLELLQFTAIDSKTKFWLEFEPCKELQGGDWYVDGALDVSKTEDLKKVFVKILEKLKDKVVTLDVICPCFERSNGVSEHSALRTGEVCYKLIGKKSGGGEVRGGVFASIYLVGLVHI
ncbi:unnamed protein product [Eruca vesicaria subsp. sativa]|uniref:Uncharacterized protein n=1 Tax=Eruca vesicaria subsp. sativa TaxID=29727 RepID=A0ABC8KWU4_ERUVS|nr:unnamed protein product [Eruca vesicaria subsp. sativa]